MEAAERKESSQELLTKKIRLMKKITNNLVWGAGRSDRMTIKSFTEWLFIYLVVRAKGA